MAFIDADHSGAGLPTPDERVRLGALMDVIVQARRSIAALQAVEAHAVAQAVRIAEEQHDRVVAAGGTANGWTFRAVAEEIAAVTGTSSRAAEALMGDAVALVDDYPAVFSRMAAGEVSLPHAHVIVEEGARLDGELRAVYADEVLGRLAENPMTPGRLRPVAKAVAEDLDPVSLTDRHTRARAQRRVVLRPAPDGMSELYAYLPAVLGAGIHERLTAMADELKTARDRDQGATDADAADTDAGAADARTVDQLRADLLADLLLTGTPSTDPQATRDGLAAIRGTVHVTIPATVLTDPFDESAAFLAGYGPIDADTARRIAAAAPTWERLFIDPDTGVLHTVDQYRPTAAQRHFLTARDERCRFPGCRTPAWRCDIDHTIPYARGGPTRVRNLAHLCASHHALKHHTAWRVEQLGGGALRWTSPTGRTYLDRPPPQVRFIDVTNDSHTAPF